MKKHKFLVERHTTLIIFLSIFILLIIIRLFNLQIINGQKYYDKTHEINVKSVETQGERGLIFDRHGEKLAYNIKVYDVKLEYRRKSNDRLNQDLLYLYDLIVSNNEKIESDLSQYIKIEPILFGEKLKSNDEIQNWLSQMVISEKDLSKLKTPQDVFEYFKKRKFYISDEYSDADAYKIMSLRYELLIKGYSKFIISKNVSIETMAKVELMKNEISGITTIERYQRRYLVSDAFAAITGYIRPIELEEVEGYYTLGYELNELVGKDGLEKSYETYLRAQKGLDIAIIEPGEYELDYKKSIEPISGFDLVTSIDAKIQQTAYDSLGENIEKIVSKKDGITNFGDTKFGSAVVLDINTGDVIASVSYPNYDANVFVSDDEEKVKKITQDESKLQLNRAIQGLYPPGSAFKPLTAIAAVEAGAYTPGELVTDDGIINYDGMDFYSMEYKKYGTTYGDIDLSFALQVSANVFFYKIGVKTGIDQIDKWARDFGLGQKTGIDIGGEAQGRRNSRETMKQIEPDRNWGRADTAQASIGQLYNQFTPLQIARYISALANGGKLYTPRIVKEINKRDGSNVLTFKPEFIDIGISPITLREVQKGMLAVANETDGSAVDIFKDFPYGRVAGKTGTPETGFEDLGVSSHSVFVCYAPYEKPEVAVCVIIENGVWGANSAPVAYDILMEYFKGKEN